MKSNNIQNAIIYLIDNNNRVLMNRRPKDNKWQFPGGQIDTGRFGKERPQDAALRELCEEVFTEKEFQTCSINILRYFRNKDLNYIDWPVENPVTRIFFAHAPTEVVNQIKDTDLTNVKGDESNRRQWINILFLGSREYPLRDVAISSHYYILKNNIIDKKLQKQQQQTIASLQDVGTDLEMNDEKCIKTIKNVFFRRN